MFEILKKKKSKEGVGGKKTWKIKKNPKSHDTRQMLNVTL